MHSGFPCVDIFLWLRILLMKQKVLGSNYNAGATNHLLRDSLFMVCDIVSTYLCASAFTKKIAIYSEGSLYSFLVFNSLVEYLLIGSLKFNEKLDRLCCNQRENIAIPRIHQNKSSV